MYSLPQGTHESLRGSEKALATVTAIIDGFGSLGAALGPLLTGYISSMRGGFDNVFLMLYIAAVCAALLISRLVVRDVQRILHPPPKKEKQKRRQRRGRTPGGGGAGAGTGGEEDGGALRARLVPPAAVTSTTGTGLGDGMGHAETV